MGRYFQAFMLGNVRLHYGFRLNQFRRKAAGSSSYELFAEQNSFTADCKIEFESDDEHQPYSI
jgi:hypothetical protein